MPEFIAEITARYWAARARVVQRLREIAALFTVGRILGFSYAAVVLLLAWWLPWPAGGAHYRALRWIGPGARVSDEMLLAPSPFTLADRLRLPGEHDRLVDHYLKRPVDAGEAVLPDDMLSWPQGDEIEKALPVELDAEPNWLEMNAGSTVQIWVDDKLKASAGRVVAIVPAGKSGWVALLAGSGFDADILGAPRSKPVLRVIELPHPREPAPAPEPHRSGG